MSIEIRRTEEQKKGAQMNNTKKNWREQDEVMVGWVYRAELGMLKCEVVKRDRTNDEPHGVSLVRFAKGAICKVVYAYSQARYVFEV